MAQSSEASILQYYHDFLSDNDKKTCTHYPKYREIKGKYDNARYARAILQQRFDSGNTFEEEMARRSIMTDARSKENEAKVKMMELARLVLAEPKFDLDVCTVKWEAGRWWCAFPGGHGEGEVRSGRQGVIAGVASGASGGAGD